MSNILERVEPVLNCYPNYGHIFSIVGRKTEDFLPWVYDHFVQVYAPNQYERGIRADFATPDMIRSFPWIETDHVNRQIINNKWDNIIEFIKDYVDRGYYIYALFDVSQISLYHANRAWYHDPLIYGYDDEDEVLYFADNYRSGKYSIGRASYKEILNATEKYEGNTEVIDWLKGVFCIRYKKIYDFGNYRLFDSYKYTFDEKLYTDLLEDFLYERNSFLRWSAPQNLVEVDDNVWGIGVNAFLREYLIYVKDNNCELDQRSFYVLLEHSKLIQKGMEYIKREKHYDFLQNELELAKENLDLCIMMCNLCVKFNVLKRQDILIKIRNKLLLLKEKQEELFVKLIKAFKL